MKTIAATGHRFPKKYINREYFEYFKDYDLWKEKIIHNLMISIIDDNPDIIISGMALGWDTWIAELALDLDIKLLCAIPFKDQAVSWKNDYDKQKYFSVVEKADKVVYISDQYHKKCFFDRDRWMVDHCDKVYALLSPEVIRGGTLYTVNYANNINKPVQNFWL